MELSSEEHGHKEVTVTWSTGAFDTHNSCHDSRVRINSITQLYYGKTEMVRRHCGKGRWGFYDLVCLVHYLFIGC